MIYIPHITRRAIISFAIPVNTAKRLTGNFCNMKRFPSSHRVSPGPKVGRLLGVTTRTTVGSPV